MNQVNFDHKKPSQFLCLPQKQVIFDSHTKIRSTLTPTQNKSISVLTLKTSQFLFPTQNQFNFDPNIEFKSISIPTLKTSQFCMPPDTYTKLISIQNSKPSFYPHKKPSQFWSHWNQVNSEPLHWAHVYFDHPHYNQVNFEANTKTMSCSGLVTMRVIHTSIKRITDRLPKPYPNYCKPY